MQEKRADNAAGWALCVLPPCRPDSLSYYPRLPTWENHRQIAFSPAPEAFLLPKTESIGLDRGLRRPPLYGSQSGLLHVWTCGSILFAQNDFHNYVLFFVKKRECEKR